MKKIILQFTLYLLLTIGLHAIPIQWQIEVSVDTEPPYTQAGAGSDGSAVVFSSANDTLYWIGSDGTMIERIPNFTGGNPDLIVYPESVSSTQLVLAILDFSNSNSIKVITKTESGLSTITLDGSSASELAFESSRPFFLVQNGNQFTLYKLNSISSPSVGVSMVPANAIVIPASHNGDVTISLEASSDLVEWNNVLPGSYSPTNEARFFRVKATTE